MADKFGKSLDNKVTERTGFDLLLLDPRFQAPDVATKKAILRGLGLAPEFGPRSFDCVLSDGPLVAPLSTSNIDEFLPRLRLVEMKSTKKAIQDLALNGFFFGATAHEYELAERLGDRFLFAFVVLGRENEYLRPFAVLLTLKQLEERTKTKRVQYQVNLKTDTNKHAARHELVVFDAAELKAQNGTPE